MQVGDKLCPHCKEFFTYDSKKSRRNKTMCDPCYEELKSKREREVRVQRWSKQKLADEKKPK